MREKRDASVVAAGVSPAREPGVPPGGKKTGYINAAFTSITAYFRAAGREPSTAGGDAWRYLT